MQVYQRSYQAFLRAKMVGHRGPPGSKPDPLLTPAAPELGLPSTFPDIGESTNLEGLCHKVCPLSNTEERIPSFREMEYCSGDMALGCSVMSLH